MKKYFLIFTLHFILIPLFSQENDRIKYALKAVNNQFQAGVIQIYDAYLSPLYYQGAVLRYEHKSRQLFKADNAKISRDNLLSVSLGLGTNPVGTSSMSYVGVQYGWGVHYHFRPIKNLQILTGLMADADLAYKMIVRNVNNPINVDISTNINLSAVVQYKIPAKRRNFLLQARFMSPFMGFMFVPEQGASYYEVFSLNNFKNTFHFSGLHNKYGLIHQYTIDIPLKRSTFQVGFGHQQMTHQANNLIFKKKHSSLILGWKYDFHAFSGRKTKVPENFIAPNL